MAENKTKPTAKSVDRFIAQITDDKKREDSAVILKRSAKQTEHAHAF